MENNLKMDTEKILNYMNDNSFIGTYKIEDDGIILWKISDRVWFIICLEWHGGDDSILYFYPHDDNDSIWDSKRKHVLGIEYANLWTRDNDDLIKEISKINNTKHFIVSQKNWLGKLKFLEIIDESEINKYKGNKKYTIENVLGY